MTKHHQGPPAETRHASSFDDLLDRFRSRFEVVLERRIEVKHRQAIEEVSAAQELTGVLKEYLHRGGKRLRPALLNYAYLGCGGTSELIATKAAMAVELLHTYLLIHDDIMDRAEMRRGGKAAHVAFRESHDAKRWRGDSQHFGESAAILLGDLAYSYATELLTEIESDLPSRDTFFECFGTMCREVILGQYLELTAPNRSDLTEADLLKVLQMKSGRYSVERPIQLGALLAGAKQAVLEQLSTYGLKVGEAFQLQDDLLGVFGDAGTVGKPVESDLAEGKRTLLVFHTLKRTSGAEKKLVIAALGNPELDSQTMENVRAIMERTGARQHIVDMIEERLEGAHKVLRKIRFEGDAEVFFRGLIAKLRGRDQ